MKTKTITIKKQADLNAEGRLSGGCCKPVICIDNGIVYTSATDAARENDTNIWGISCACRGKIKHTKGKRFCYVQDIPERLDDIVAQIRELAYKANEYDKIVYEREAKQKAAETVAKLEAERKKAEIKLSKIMLDLEAAKRNI